MGDVYTERNKRGNDSLKILSVSIHHGVSNEELDSNTLGKEVRRSEDKSLYKHVYLGDLVLNMMRAWQGAVGVVKSEAMVSPAYITAVPSAELYPLFMDFYLRRDEAIGQMNNLSYGVTDFRKRLYWDSFVKVLCHIPTVAEQERITVFFTHLDDTIALHQRKLTLFNQLKETYLKQMFPQNEENMSVLRFADFSEPWEQRKWSETVDISTEMVNPKTGEYDSLPHIGPGNIESFTGRILDNVKSVKEDNLISGKFHFYPGDVIYGKINPQLGKYAMVDFEGLASADSYVLNTKNGVSQTFLFTILQGTSFYKYSVSVSMRTGMPKINRDELNQYSYSAPSIVEQEKIGHFFQQLDDTSALHQEKIAHLKVLKTTLLNKMFI